MHQNLVPTIYHTQHICHPVWKTVRATFFALFFSNRGEKVLKSMKIMGQICPIVLLLVIGQQQYIEM